MRLPGRRKAAVLVLACVVAFLVWHGRTRDRPESRDGGVHEGELTIEQTLAAGVNLVTFDYAGREADLESVSMHCVQAPGEIEIVGVMASPGQELSWRVFSDTPGRGVFRVSWGTP